MTDLKSGDRVGTRTVIHVNTNQIIFGERIGSLENCGAWLTNFTEWAEYAASQKERER